MGKIEKKPQISEITSTKICKFVKFGIKMFCKNY